MRLNPDLLYFLTASTALTLVCGCSAGGTSAPLVSSVPAELQSSVRSLNGSVPPGTMPNVLRPGTIRQGAPDVTAGFANADAKKTGVIVVSDAGTNSIEVFTLTGTRVATITGFKQPQGITADPAGNIYIADSGASDVRIYKDDYKTLLATLVDANQFPASVSYDSRTGTIGVTNLLTTSGGRGSVSLFAKGRLTPCATVSSNDFTRVYFGAFDDAGNLFVDGLSANGNVVVGEVTGGCKATTIATLTVSNTIGFPGGIQVSPTDTIAIEDQSNAAIYAYAAPVRGELGTPLSTTHLNGASDPVSFVFTKKASDVFSVDAGAADINEYRYPGGGSPIASITGFKQPVGFVVVPVETP